MEQPSRSTEKRTAADAQLESSDFPNAKRRRTIRRENSMTTAAGAIFSSTNNDTGIGTNSQQSSSVEHVSVNDHNDKGPQPEQEVRWSNLNASFELLHQAGFTLNGEPNMDDRKAFRTYLEQRYPVNDVRRGSPMLQYLLERTQGRPNQCNGGQGVMYLATLLDSSEFTVWTETRPEFTNILRPHCKPLYEDPRPHHERDHYPMRKKYWEIEDPEEERRIEVPQISSVPQRKSNNGRRERKQRPDQGELPGGRKNKQRVEKGQKSMQSKPEHTQYVKRLRSGVGNRKHAPRGKLPRYPTSNFLVADYGRSCPPCEDWTSRSRSLWLLRKNRSLSISENATNGGGVGLRREVGSNSHDRGFNHAQKSFENEGPEDDEAKASRSMQEREIQSES